jgi:hypothetical protein
MKNKLATTFLMLVAAVAVLACPLRADASDASSGEAPLPDANTGGTDNTGSTGGTWALGTNWAEGMTGVRVSILTPDGAVLSGQDYTYVTDPRKNPNDPDITWGGVSVSKVGYMNGHSFNPSSAIPYDKIQLNDLPHGLGGSWHINMRDYFSTHDAISMVAADAADMDVETFIANKYALIIEPVMYFQYNYVNYALTAHEAMLLKQGYGWYVSEGLATLAKSAYLEYDDRYQTGLETPPPMAPISC